MKMNKIKCAIVGIILLSAAHMGFCQDVLESIIAVVNDEIITLSEYRNRHDALYQMLSSRFEGEELQREFQNMKKDLLDSMVTDLLLLQEARKNELDVSEQMKMTIENIQKENNLDTEDQLRRAMLQQGMNYDAWRGQIEENLLKQAIVYTQVSRNIVINDTEVVGYYKTHQDEFIEPPEYTLKAVYIAESGKSEEEIRNKKVEVEEKIAAGEDFAAVSGQFSEGPEKDSEGDLGTFKAGEMEKILEESVKNLDIGGVTPWIAFREGWFLLKLVDRRDRRLREFDEVREEIEQILFEDQKQKKLDEYMVDLKQRSFIKIVNPKPYEILGG